MNFGHNEDFIMNDKERLLSLPGLGLSEPPRYQLFF